MPNNHDHLTRFLLERANVRGVLVHLDQTWQAIIERSHYPPAVAEYLGQCTVAAALFTAALKFNGRLSIQLRGESAIRRLFAECTTEGSLRAIAHFDDDVAPDITLGDFGEKAMLAITIEKNRPGHQDPQRYQGIVALQAGTLSEAFEQYFMQSEQLPTRMLFFKQGQRLAGMLIQQLPEQANSNDDWQRAQALFETLGGDELFALDAEEILYRLFHEEYVHVLESRPLEFACSCSRERVENALISLGQAEIVETLAENAEITVHCDFCGQGYVFTDTQALALFWPDAVAPGSDRLQ